MLVPQQICPVVWKITTGESKNLSKPAVPEYWYILKYLLNYWLPGKEKRTSKSKKQKVY